MLIFQKEYIILLLVLITIRGAILRNTKQKEIILSIVNNSSNHFNANGIYLKVKEVIPNISLGTVYRNLNNLVLENKIIRLKMSDGIDRFDKNIIHAHVVCMICDKIDDVMYDYIKKCLIQKIMK